MATLYEIVTIINPDETDDGVDAIIGGLRQTLTQSGGEILAVDKWGRRKLAYPIQKKAEGFYVLMHVEGPPNLPRDFRAHTKIRESILRELVVKLEDAHEAAVRKQLEETGPEDTAAAEAQIAAAEERAASKRAAAAMTAAEAVAAAAETESAAAEAEAAPEPEPEAIHAVDSSVSAEPPEAAETTAAPDVDPEDDSLAPSDADNPDNPDNPDKED